jgi:hypothetical protein
MAEAKHMRTLLHDERGGAHILVFTLLAIGFSVLLFVVSIQWMLQSANKTKSKLALDRAVHAASLHVDPYEAASGRLVWDEVAGEADFYRYLQLNFQLDEAGQPQAGSHLPASPMVHTLEFVTSATYPAVIERVVDVMSDGASIASRHVEVTVYGPSVVAIVEVRQQGLGRTEPILLSSVASIRFR